MISLGRFIEFCRQHSSANRLAEKVVDIFENADATNRQGHIKQAFYAVQALFDEDSSRIATVLWEPSRQVYQLHTSPLLPEWRRFLSEHRNDPMTDDGASIQRLRNVLNTRLGGVQTTGGGADYELKLVITIAARFFATEKYSASQQ